VSAALFQTILCADWAKGQKGREVYRADAKERAVCREQPPAGNWTVAYVISRAEELRKDGTVLVAFDAPIGVPRTYLEAAALELEECRACKTFVDWVLAATGNPDFFEETADCEKWHLRRPFFAIPAGAGSRGRWEARLHALGAEPLRTIDRLTRANPTFVVRGIPGSVGSAARDLWAGLVPYLKEEPRRIALWPFEGSLSELARRDEIVVGEIYPRAAYAIALSPEPAHIRRPLSLAKNKFNVRRTAIDQLAGAGWVREHAVRLGDLEPALDSADAFDALLTAAALLRCTLEETPFSRANLEDAVEGGILGCGSILFQARSDPQPRGSAHAPPRTEPVRPHPCPIPDCPHVYAGSRGGWDAHVASRRGHQAWHPELTDPEHRKQQFRREYPEFFE
jgi:hypothetical protein